jgi:hypothetical protein
MQSIVQPSPLSSPEVKRSFSILPGEYSVVRLGASDPVPDWALAGSFFSVTRTSEELSIVCPSAPAGAKSEPGWAVLKLRGPFAFDEVGVLEAFLRPLAAAGVSVFAVSTFDTDYILVKADRLNRALTALAGAGHERADPAGGSP